MKALNLAGGGDETETGRDPLKIMANQISKFKDNLVTPQGATAWIESKIAAAERTGEPRDVHGLAPARGSMPIINIVCVRERG